MNDITCLTHHWIKKDKDVSSFWIEVKKATRPEETWEKEIDLAALKIVEKAQNKPIWLALSGGIDSEVMCQSFLKMKIPFKVITVEHLNGTNNHDISFAIDWCKKNNVEQKIIKIDIVKYLTTDIYKYVEKNYYTRHLFRYINLRIFEVVEEMGGYCVFGGGEQNYKILGDVDGSNNTAPILWFDIGYAVFFEWFKEHKVEHQPNFYWSTPELTLAYMNIPVVNFCLKNPDVFKHPKNSRLLKILAYQSVFPQLVSRPKNTGYENVSELKLQTETKLKEIFAKNIISNYIPVSELYQKLSFTDSRLL